MADIELAGTFLIAGIFIVSLLTLNAEIMESNTINSMTVSAQQNVTNIAGILLNDLQKIGQGLSSAETAILNYSNSTISYLADLDQDGTPDTLSYRLGPTTDLAGTDNTRDRLLYRSVNGAETDVALGLTQLSFSYYDTQDNPCADPAEIRSIGIAFSVETANAYLGRYGSAEWQGRVAPKNLKAR